VDKVRRAADAPWGSSTNFVAFFEDLILLMAIRNSLEPEEMVK
jgi:hypothetical protein